MCLIGGTPRKRQVQGTLADRSPLMGASLAGQDPEVGADHWPERPTTMCGYVAGRSTTPVGPGGGGPATHVGDSAVGMDVSRGLMYAECRVYEGEHHYYYCGMGQTLEEWKARVTDSNNFRGYECQSMLKFKGYRTSP